MKNDLQDAIFKSGYSIPEFIELFDISYRTFERWQKKTPRHVLRILIKLRNHSPAWDGWTYDRHFIIDPNGNDYTQIDVLNIFWTRQLIETLTGSTGQVKSLKTHLEQRIKAQQANTLSISLHAGPDEIKHWNVQL